MNIRGHQVEAQAQCWYKMLFAVAVAGSQWVLRPESDDSIIYLSVAGYKLEYWLSSAGYGYCTNQTRMPLDEMRIGQYPYSKEEKLLRQMILSAPLFFREHQALIQSLRRFLTKGNLHEA